MFLFHVVLLVTAIRDPLILEEEYKLVAMWGGMCLYADERWCKRANVCLRVGACTEDLGLLSASLRARYTYLELHECSAQQRTPTSLTRLLLPELARQTILWSVICNPSLPTHSVIVDDTTMIYSN